MLGPGSPVAARYGVSSNHRRSPGNIRERKAARRAADRRSIAAPVASQEAGAVWDAWQGSVSVDVMATSLVPSSLLHERQRQRLAALLQSAAQGSRLFKRI